MVNFLKSTLIDDIVTKFFIDYFSDSGFRKAFIAISGGVDSATVAYLATKIMKPENIVVAFFPSSITSSDSKNYFYKVVEELKIKNYHEISIDNFLMPYIHYDETLNSGDMKSKLRKGNIMARIRMILSYDIAAKYNALVVGTENKTEYLLGYSTQWGDAAAAFHPLGDIYKTEVFNYASFLGVPEQIVNRIPSAELWENQADENEIGVKYEIIDKILYLLYERNLSKNDLISMGFSESEIDRIIELNKKSEYKRRLPLSASFKNLRRYC